MSGLEIVLCSTVFVLLFSLIATASKALKFRKRIKTLIVAYSKIESLASLKNNKELDSDTHKENFIKFLSDSRDAAYEYIETTQEAILTFQSKVGSLVEYFDEYGDVISVERPDYAAMKQISSAYKELMLVLPEDENVKDKE